MNVTLPPGQVVMLATVGWLLTVVLLIGLGLRFTGWLRGGAA